MDINFELYKTFYHAAKCSSFSSAAQQLFISQSAVSQSVKNLEEKLGVTLFYRKNRSIQLTTEGDLLFRHIEQAYNFIKTGEGKIHDMQNLDLGQISIGVSDTTCKYFLIPYLKNFVSLYPKIKVQVINRTSSQIVEILENGLVDFGIVTLPLCDHLLEIKPFRQVKDIFVASEKFVELKGCSTSIKKLSEYPLLTLKKDSATRRNLDSFLQNIGVNLTPEIELESVDLLIEFARIGLGIAHVLKESAQDFIDTGELFEIHTTKTLPKRELGIILMPNVPLSYAAKAFIQLLGKELQ